MTRKVLYLLRQPVVDPLILNLQDPDDASIVLIQDAVSLRDLPTKHVYILEDDTGRTPEQSVFPIISHREMLRMMFDSERVVVL